MIPPELVRARRRGDQLQLQKLTSADRAVAVNLAEEMLLAARSNLGESHEVVDSALSAVDHEARHQKLWGSLKKLVLDDCSFEAGIDVDPVELRRELFTRAAEVRAGLEVGEPFPRDEIVAEVAAAHAAPSQVIEDGLYGDLKSAQKLTRAPAGSAEELVERFEVAQLQGVLLRAVRVEAKVRCSSAAAYRKLFHRLKFRQLLYTLTRLDDGRYCVEMDGPFSLFESSTRYGMALAMMVPVLLECDSVELRAKLRWGKERRDLEFSTTLGGGGRPSQPDKRPEIEALVAAVAKRKVPKGATAWKASVASKLLDLPGIGVVIPDLKFSAPDQPTVYLEVMGFWSRDAVWQRVEWSESKERAGDATRVLFAVSDRLRVSEQVLPKGGSAALYVYKGVMSAKSVLEQVEALASS